MWLRVMLEACAQYYEGTEKYLPVDGVRKSFPKMTTDISLKGWVQVNRAREGDGRKHFKRGQFGVIKAQKRNW